MGDPSAESGSGGVGSPDDSARVALLLGICFGIVGVANASSALSLTAISGEFEVAKGVVTWSVTLYGLVLSVSTAVYGRLADRYGFRRPFAAGIALLAVGSAIAATAPEFWLHLAGRTVQGLGAGVVPTVGMAVVSTRYRGATRSSALITLSLVGVVCGALGQLLVGAVLDLASWRWAMAMPMIALALLPPLWKALGSAAIGASLDAVGALLVTATATGAMLLISSPATGGDVALIGLLLTGFGLPLTAVWSWRRPNGFLPSAVTRSSVVLAPAAAGSAMTAAWYALLVAMPWELAAAGWPNVAIGLALVPGALLGLVFRSPMERLSGRLAAPASLAAGMGTAGAALVLAAVGAYGDLPFALVVAGVAMPLAFGLGQPAMVTLATVRVAVAHRGVALGVTTLVFMMGGSAGAALVGGLGPRWGTAAPLAVLAILSLGGAVLARRITAEATEPPQHP